MVSVPPSRGGENKILVDSLIMAVEYKVVLNFLLTINLIILITVHYVRVACQNARSDARSNIQPSFILPVLMNSEQTVR